MLSTTAGVVVTTDCQLEACGEMSPSHVCDSVFETGLVRVVRITLNVSGTTSGAGLWTEEKGGGKQTTNIHLSLLSERESMASSRTSHAVPPPLRWTAPQL